jgi:hypothetical protein
LCSDPGVVYKSVMSKGPRKISQHRITFWLPNWLAEAITAEATIKKMTTANFVRTALLQAVQPALLGHSCKKAPEDDNKQSYSSS